jgi:hypothetical protein
MGTLRGSTCSRRFFNEPAENAGAVHALVSVEKDYNKDLQALRFAGLIAANGLCHSHRWE